jgi:hypothetical protein
MKKTSTITINDKIITVNELTVRQMMNIKDSFSGDTLSAMQQLLPLLTDATPDFLLDLAPSELMELWEKVKEVNASFLAVLPLEKILAGYQETLVQTIQNNLSTLSAGLLPPAME